ncbi:hypothetical protein PIB30_003220 [Stylosanthes scabra]|uniref:Uncharacterized protein n=1 Tax=Stylosanthes scabra TaxID=79078 RepID=A0ABU6Q344_9FABA|nr:hypothetical protein [Stylosanthes scabra]
MCGEHIVTLRKQFEPCEKVLVLIHYLNWELFSAQKITEEFDILPAFPDGTLYAGRILPGGVRQQLELAHGFIFYRNRELILDEDHMGEVVIQTSPSVVSSHNSWIGEDLQDDASSLGVWILGMMTMEPTIEEFLPGHKQGHDSLFDCLRFLRNKTKNLSRILEGVEVMYKEEKEFQAKRQWEEIAKAKTGRWVRWDCLQHGQLSQSVQETME